MGVNARYASHLLYLYPGVRTSSLHPFNDPILQRVCQMCFIKDCETCTFPVGNGNTGASKCTKDKLVQQVEWQQEGSVLQIDLSAQDLA